MEHETGVTVLYTNGDTASTRGRRHTVTDPAMHTQRTRAPLETRTNRRGASKAGGPSSQPPPRASAEPGAESGKTACPAKAPDPQPEVLTGAEERARAGCGWTTRPPFLGWRDARRMGHRAPRALDAGPILLPLACQNIEHIISRVSRKDNEAIDDELPSCVVDCSTATPTYTKSAPKERRSQKCIAKDGMVVVEMTTHTHTHARRKWSQSSGG